MGAVAGAEPAAEVAGLADRDTTQMGADTYRHSMLVVIASVNCIGAMCRGGEGVRDLRTQHNKPLRLLNTVLIGLGITEGRNGDLVRRVDLALSPVTDENGLASPLDDDLWSLCQSACSVAVRTRVFNRIVDFGNVRSCPREWR